MGIKIPFMWSILTSLLLTSLLTSCVSQQYLQKKVAEAKGEEWPPKVKTEEQEYKDFMDHR